MYLVWSSSAPMHSLFIMDVILNLREMDIEAEFDASGNPTPEFLSNIIQAIIQEYGARASDSEAFIYPELTASNCVFGFKEPVRLLQRVSEWNGSIREQFLRWMRSARFLRMANCQPQTNCRSQRARRCTPC